MSSGAASITDAIRKSDGAAVCAYVTGGYPTPEVFPELLTAISEVADVVEIGVPFTDPMADGQTIQKSSNVALGNGVTLGWLLEMLGSTDLSAPHLLMGYVNPFMAHGFDRLFDQMVDVGCAGMIVPDLSFEESDDIRESMDDRELALVQLVAPTTPDHRLGRLAEASRGFVYAVTITGVTGGATSFDRAALEYLDRVAAASALPVLAGFGVRDRSQVEQLTDHVDGVVVGSALIDAIDRDDDPVAFLKSLKGDGSTP